MCTGSFLSIRLPELLLLITLLPLSPTDFAVFCRALLPRAQLLRSPSPAPCDATSPAELLHPKRRPPKAGRGGMGCRNPDIRLSPRDVATPACTQQQEGWRHAELPCSPLQYGHLRCAFSLFDFSLLVCVLSALQRASWETYAFNYRCIVMGF